jgi:hypothetical protein
MKWYDQSIPKIQDVLPHINKIGTEIKKCQSVKSIYAYNNFAMNFDKPDERLKQFDILVKTDFESGDLLAIDSTDNEVFSLSVQSLSEMGYNTAAVKFTKLIANIKPSYIDFYALSNDKKILHFGAIPESLEEHEIMQKEAENKTRSDTGFDSNSFINLTNSQRKKWQEIYEKYLHDFAKGCPQGWYALQNKPNNKLLNIREIIT